MNLAQHPELLDKLAAAYALGTLRGGARRRFEAMARQSATVRTAALLWQERMHAMTELAPPITPSPNVWKRIENLLPNAMAAMPNADSLQNAWQASLTALQKALGRWRFAALSGGLAALAAVVVGVQTTRGLDGEVGRLQAQLASAPQVQYVAVLSNDKAAAQVLVTFDPVSKRLSLQRVGGYQEAADRSLQLWALPSAGAPQSLGVLKPDKLVKLAADGAQIKGVPTLAVSLEPLGGVPSAGGPTGPVLFTGALIERTL